MKCELHDFGAFFVMNYQYVRCCTVFEMSHGKTIKTPVLKHQPVMRIDFDQISFQPNDKEMSRLVGKPTMWFPNRSDTNRAVQ